MEDDRPRLPGRPEALPFDHDQIVGRAAETLRARYREHPDPNHLLTGPFTIRSLRLVHEAVEGGEPLQKDTFRRRVEPKLRRAGPAVVDGRGRPAHLYTAP